MLGSEGESWNKGTWKGKKGRGKWNKRERKGKRQNSTLWRNMIMNQETVRQRQRKKEVKKQRDKERYTDRDK